MEDPADQNLGKPGTRTGNYDARTDIIEKAREQSMKDKIISVLLLEDNSADVRRFREMLPEGPMGGFKVESVSDLPMALSRLSKGGIDVILSDLLLPAKKGIDIVRMLHQKFPEIPLVVLTRGYWDEGIVFTALQEGAQDYLFKDESTTSSLRRVIFLAMERHRVEQDLMETKKELVHKIFELSRANEELKDAQSMLIQTEKLQSVGRLAAGVAHEIKNPLMIILQGVEYLKRNWAASKQDQVNSVLKDVEQGVERADSIVRGLVDFSAFQELTLKDGNLNPVIDSALSLVKHELDKKHIQVEKQLSEDLSLVKFDMSKIQQVLVILYMNAIQAMPEHGTLAVRTFVKKLTKAAAQGGRRKTDRFRPEETVVVAEVEDNGTGIRKEHFPKIFDPFFTTKPPGEGTGLGLSVAQKIMDLHGGAIEVNNRKEGGVRATLFFKIADGQKEEAA